MYDGDTLIWGIEPDGTTAQATQPASKGGDEKTTTEPASSDSVSTVKGDANLDGNVTISDCVAILQYLANGEKYPMKGQALINADVDGNPGVTGTDAGEIQKYDAGIIKEFK